MIPDKTTRTIDHANEIFARLDERTGPAGDAAERERRRLNSSFGRTLAKAGVAIGVIGIPAIYIDMLAPIGMIGWLVAAGLGTGAVALSVLSGGREIAAPNIMIDLPNAQMVQRFDSYLFRARRSLPAPAQREIDLLSAQLPLLKQVLERVPDLDPTAQDARRLMSIHLPNLIDRYAHVPAAFRKQVDDEGITVNDRLVEALASGRGALTDITRRLAQDDLAAFETQGRFIQSRYSGDDKGTLQLPAGDTRSASPPPDPPE